MRANLATVDARRTLGAAARATANQELVDYVLRTRASERAMARAERVLPLGVASSFQVYEPHPLAILPRSRGSSRSRSLGRNLLVTAVSAGYRAEAARRARASSSRFSSAT